MVTSWDIRYFISTSSSLAAIFNFSPTLTSSCNIRTTMLLVAKDMRIPLKFYIYSISNIRFKCFRFHVRHFVFGWTRIEMCTWRCCYHQRWLRHPQKQTQQRWIGFQRWFTPFDSVVIKFITFSPNNHPHHLHFWWRNSITCWTISKISTSFHQALMAQGIRRLPPAAPL